MKNINKALEERNKQNNNNDNTNNDSNDNIIHNIVPKPSGNTNNGNANNGNTNNGNTDNNHNEDKVSGKKNWKKLTKNKFYFQAQPVVPEDEDETASETIYYQK